MTPRWPTVDVNSLIDSIVRHLSVGQEIIAGNSRDRAITRVRTLLVHVLVQRCGLSLNETARVLGISKWRVRRAVRRAVTAVELADIDAWLEHM
jgi:chromosomal replication initiation ATPase DnaA